MQQRYKYTELREVPPAHQRRFRDTSKRPRINRSQSHEEYTPHTYQADTEERFYDSYHHEKRSVLRTGRQRKKFSTRTKGGEFQSNKYKRRLYFCCVSSAIDIQGVEEYVNTRLSSPNSPWVCRQYDEALCLSRHGSGNPPTPSSRPVDINLQDASSALERRPTLEETDLLDLNMSNPANQELFIFEFGAAVFWGFSRGEESRLLDIIREFVPASSEDSSATHTTLTSQHRFIELDEFAAGEDDMAFETSHVVSKATIANDVILLPEITSVKHRLAISFALAQSCVLSVLEYRIACKVEEYRYIPETMANTGKISLTEGFIGRMTGEIYVIRHDLNLHSDILDTPDFFWKEIKYEEPYHMVMRYLEMTSRVELLNTRLDMIREVLRVLQNKMEHKNKARLEWIVIWLIVLDICVKIVGGIYFLIFGSTTGRKLVEEEPVL